MARPLIDKNLQSDIEQIKRQYETSLGIKLSTPKVIRLLVEKHKKDPFNIKRKPKSKQFQLW